jgi:hypothetical protein
VAGIVPGPQTPKVVMAIQVYPITLVVQKLNTVGVVEEEVTTLQAHLLNLSANRAEETVEPPVPEIINQAILAVPILAVAVAVDRPIVRNRQEVEAPME